MDKEIQMIITKLGLTKLWDNDYIKECYSSDISIELENPKRSRPLFNWAYYLFPQGCIFPLHKLLSDESWQVCLGGAVDLFLIHDHDVETIRVGSNLEEGELPFYVVKNNTWFAATPAPNSKYSLISHCVSPGWNPEDDIPGYYNEMIKLLPSNPDFVKKFSWPESRKEYTKHTDYKSF